MFVETLSFLSIGIHRIDQTIRDASKMTRFQHRHDTFFECIPTASLDAQSSSLGNHELSHSALHEPSYPPCLLDPISARINSIDMHYALFLTFVFAMYSFCTDEATVRRPNVKDCTECLEVRAKLGPLWNTAGLRKRVAIAAAIVEYN